MSQIDIDGVFSANHKALDLIPSSQRVAEQYLNLADVWRHSKFGYNDNSYQIKKTTIHNNLIKNCRKDLDCA